MPDSWFPNAALGEALCPRGEIAVLKVPEDAFSCRWAQSFLLLFRTWNKCSADCLISGNPTSCHGSCADQDYMGTVSTIIFALPLF